MEIPKHLLRQTEGHGYEENGFGGCDCDLEGGDPDCKVQPPYETVDTYVERLIRTIIDLEAKIK